MKRQVYSPQDLIQEFYYASYVYWLSEEQVDFWISEILREKYSLYRVMKHKKTKSIFMCEWIEDWELISDEWMTSPDRFVSMMVGEYMNASKKLHS